MIGLGRMARALLLPLLEQEIIPRDQVQAVVASEDSARRLRAELGVAVGCDPSPAWAAPVVLLAVKPQLLEVVASAAPPPPPPGQEAPLLLSVLAGVTLARLERAFPGWRCVRAVPNTPCLVGAGITGLAWAEGLSAEQRQWVLDLFAYVGVVKVLPESQLDGLLALASSGPALAAVLLEALADGGVASGLPRALALELALGMMGGSVTLLREQGLHPAQLKDMVASPAGTTIAALRQLEQGGVRGALIEAVLAAAERSRALNAG